MVLLFLFQFQSVAMVFATGLNLHRKCRIASGAQKFYPAGVKHSGKAAQSALKLVGFSLAGVVVLLAVAFLAKWVAIFVLGLTWVLIALWILFAVFTVYFFRDPNPLVPGAPKAVVAPGHGKVDVIDMAMEDEFIRGECRRISIFLSVFDVHVQNAPVTGRIAYFKHTAGAYLNAMRTDSAQFNENVLIGIESADPRGEKVGVRLIAGLIARRIVPWVTQNDTVLRGERISLIQFGSRVDVYLPKTAAVKVKLGERVVGGQTILASLE
jgi:phosphatidylserine decarboxylase